MISAKDLKIGDHVIYNDKPLNRDEEVIVRFVNEDYCGLSHIGERSCFLVYYKDDRMKKVK